MPRARAATALLPLVALTALVGCAADATEPSPSPSATTSPSPSVDADPEPQTRGEMPIDCLNVLAPEVLDGIAAAAPFEVPGFGVRMGASDREASVDAGSAPVDAVRSASCYLVSADGTSFELAYLEFDPADTEARLAGLAAFGDEGERYQPPGTDLALTAVPGIPEAQQLQIPFPQPYGVRTKTWVVGPGWEVYVDAPWVVTNAAAAIPGPIGEGLAAHAPVGQACPTMLPVPTEQLDLELRYDLSSSETVASDGIVCHAGEASGYERVLWWEDLAPDARETLLDDAAAGVDGMALQGSTNDGSGAIVLRADGTRLIVFDAHLVHLELTANGELALQLARHIHPPAWPEVPPVA